MARYRNSTDEYKPEGAVMDTGHNISTALDGSNEFINSTIATRLKDGEFPHNFLHVSKDRVLPDELAVLADATHVDRSGGRFYYDYGKSGFLEVTFRKGDGRVWITASSTSQELAKRMVEEFQDKLEEFKGAIVPEGQVRVNFWNMTARGPSRRPRKLDMPTWDEIQGNYESRTVSDITEFMTMKEWDDSRGKLIIWRGEPGLGKTYALRAMCDNWQTWASIHYITDPEQFLTDPDYLYSVMGFDEDDMPGHLLYMLDDDDLQEYQKTNPITHRLIILEDAGELVGAEARSNTGQALSRLLNAVDGMFGQGTKCVLMITTNEEKGKLHPAVGRHGRCAKDVTFQTFDIDQAIDWLKENGGDPKDALHGMSLSDLFAAMHKHNNQGSAKDTKSIGFAGVA